jgi:DDE superfamily endonuclease
LSQHGSVVAIQSLDSTRGMKHSHRLPASPDPLPARFLSCLAEFADLFTRPTWPNVLMLLVGVILTPGRRTIAAALRILGRERDPKFCTFHRILNRAAWSSRAAASRLLLLLTASFLPAAAPVVIGLDDTIERRWGPKISARGIYRDPVRSSKGHFVKASGLRWLSAMLLVPVPWADRIMALPFLTVLAPSKRFYAAKLRNRRQSLIGRGKPHCKSTAGCLVATSFWSPTAPLPPSNSSPRWANTSASSPGCGSTLTCLPSRRQSIKAAADRRSRESD